MVTMARAQHKASLLLKVMMYRFFLFSPSRHRRSGLGLEVRVEVRRTEGRPWLLYWYA